MKMMKIGSGMLVLAFAAGLAYAGNDDMTKVVKELEKKIEDQGIYVESDTPGVKLSGYVDAGYMYNFTGSRAVVPYRNNPERVAQGDFSVFDSKIALEKPLSDKPDEYSAGFRIDLRFGEDEFGTQSGNIQIQQAYAQFRVPVGNGLDFKVGKFVTLIGYEYQERLLNANITHSLQFWNLEPSQHVGILMKYAFNDIVTVQFGVANGWNNDNGEFLGLDINKDSVDPYCVTGSIAINAPGGNATWYNGFIYSFDGEPALGSDAQLADDVFVWNSWGYWKPKFGNDKLTLAFASDFGFTEPGRGSIGGVEGPKNGNTFYAVALYAGYRVTDKFYINTRGEYLHSDDGSMPYGRYPDFGADIPKGADEFQIAAYNYDLWSWTITFGFDIWENLTTRLEYRLDWGNELVDSPGGSDDEDGPAHLIAAQVGYRF